MEHQIILSKQNRHRANEVKSISRPNMGVLKLSHEVTNNRAYCSVAYEGFDSAIIPEDYSDWEVVSWKYDISLEEYWEAAYRAFYWSSFDPERSGERTIISYENELNNDLKDMPVEQHERYINNYKKYFSAWLHAHSDCASSAITGGSGFNTRRAEKANSRERARMGDFIEWRERALKAIAKHIEDSKPEEVKRAEVWAKLEESIRDSAATIEGINKGTVRGYNKALFVSSIYNKIETYAKRGDVYIVDLAIALIRDLNQYSSIITERHKFFKLPELAVSAQEKLSDLNKAESIEVPFDGGVVVKNFAENRIQIIHDSKPEPDVIQNLKRNGFRWSPRFTAWQRQLTNNGIHAVCKVVPVTYDQLT